MPTVRQESRPWDPLRGPLLDLLGMGQEIYNFTPRTGYTGDFTVTGPNADIDRAMDMSRTLGETQYRQGLGFNPLVQQLLGGAGSGSALLNTIGRTAGGQIQTLGSNIARNASPLLGMSQDLRSLSSGVGARENLFDTLGNRASGYSSDLANRVGGFDALSGRVSGIADSMGGRANELYGAGRTLQPQAQYLGQQGRQAIDLGGRAINQGLDRAGTTFNIGTSGLTNQATSGASQGLATLQGTARGDHLRGSPELDAAMQAAINPAIQNYQRTIAPGITSSAISRGAYGGNREGLAQGVAAGDLSRNILDTTSSMSYANLARERGLQHDAASQLPGQFLGLQQGDINRALSQEQGQGMRIGQGLQMAGFGQGQQGLGTQMIGQQGNLLGQMANMYQGAAGQNLAQGNLYGLSGDLRNTGSQQLLGAGQLAQSAGGLYGMGTDQRLAQANIMGQSGGMLGQYGNMLGQGANTIGQGANLRMGGALSGLDFLGQSGQNALALQSGGNALRQGGIGTLLGGGQLQQGYHENQIRNAILQQQEAEQAPWRGLEQFTNTLTPGLGFSSSRQSGGGTDPLMQGIQGLGGIGMGLAGIASLFSDRRLKDIHRKIGETEAGVPLYLFNYKGDDKFYIGVIAQELQETQPDAVFEVDGYLAVDYSKVK